MIDEEINKLKRKVINFAFHTHNMLKSCLTGLTERDNNLLMSVIVKEEKKANKLDLNIEKHCVSTIAQYGPKASHLRAVLMIMKMNNDLERMADHCVNISHCVLDIFDNLVYYMPNDDLTLMFQKVLAMIDNSVKAFIESDDKLAKKVCDSDELINQLKHQLTEYFAERIQEDGEKINDYLNLMEVVRNLERIADLSTNVSEDVVYMSEGIVIKHPKL